MGHTFKPRCLNTIKNERVIPDTLIDPGGLEMMGSVGVTGLPSEQEAFEIELVVVCIR